MVRFADLKVGDKIAREITELVGDKLMKVHTEPYTVSLVLTNYTQRSILTQDAMGREYWMHDLQFITIDDTLARWVKVEA